MFKNNYICFLSASPLMSIRSINNIKDFESLYRDYFSWLVKMAYGILYDLDEAKDVVQETFLDLWDNRSEIQIKTSAKSYLYSMVKYKCFNKISSLNILDKKNVQLWEASLLSFDVEKNDEHELAERAIQILRALPQQMRRIAELHIFHGLKIREISEDLGISANTVKTHLKRAFKRLRVSADILKLTILIYLTELL